MIEKVRMIPRTRDDIKEIKTRGIKAWLTWATIDQACGNDSLRWWQKLSRKLFSQECSLVNEGDI